MGIHVSFFSLHNLIEVMRGAAKVFRDETFEDEQRFIDMLQNGHENVVFFDILNYRVYE